MTDKDIEDILALEPDENVEYTAEGLRQTTKIRGWLPVFFIIELMLVLFILLPQIFLPQANEQLFSPDTNKGPAFRIYSLFQGFFGLAMLIYTFFCFAKRRHEAVFMARIYTGYGLISVFLSCVNAGFYSASATAQFLFLMLVFGIMAMAYDGAWLAYFHLSKQVNRLCPKPYRRRYWYNYLFAAIYAVFLIVQFIQNF